VLVHSVTYTQRLYRLTTHFSENIPFGTRHMTLLKVCIIYCVNTMKYDRHSILGNTKILDSCLDSIAQYSVTPCLPSSKHSPSTVFPNGMRCDPCEFRDFKSFFLFQNTWLLLAKIAQSFVSLNLKGAIHFQLNKAILFVTSHLTEVSKLRSFDRQ